MNHVSFYITWMVGCVCVAYLENTWHQDALWEEGKPVEALCTLSWQWYSLMALASFSRIMHPATKQKWFRNDLRNNEFKVLDLASKFPRSQSN